MRPTLLDMTQTILSSLSSDEVNSISDTTESLQVAEILKTTYFNIITRTGLETQKQLYELDSAANPVQPTLMTRPLGVNSTVNKMEWMKYFNESNPPDVPQYQYVTILPFQDFLNMVNNFNPDETNVGQFDLSVTNGTFTFYYRNDKQPQFCTALQNFYILFDSYDATVESNLQSSKTMCYGEIEPSWQMVDTFVPALSDDQFPLLINEAKSLAYFELKQAAHPKAEQEAKRQWGALQKGKSLTDKPSYFDQLPNFGRRGGGYRSTVSLFKERGWDVI